MKTCSIYIFALLVPAIASLFGCDSEQPGVRHEPRTDSGSLPDAETGGATIQIYDRDRVTTEIQADKIFKFEKIDSTIGYHVDIRFFDSVGQVNSVLIGDSSVSRENSGRFSVYGNVLVRTSDSSRLETDYLHWDPDMKKIRTDAFVKIYKAGDVVTGWGMEADHKLSRIKILRQVSGSFRDTSSVLGE